MRLRASRGDQHDALQFRAMIILGVICVIAGILLPQFGILVTVGVICVIIGIVLVLLGRTGHRVGGRAHWW